jgi:WhiB family transcriptional regulator, redox-sensing transcriptional regulator
MPEGTTTDSRSVRLLTIAMPVPSATGLGEWPSRSLCVSEAPEVFFPSHGRHGAEARRICAACPVRDECLNYATAADEFGIWGGLDQQERRNLKRRQQRRNAAFQVRASGAGGAA